MRSTLHPALRLKSVTLTAAPRRQAALHPHGARTLVAAAAKAPCILLCNDDGVDSVALQALGDELRAATGLRVVTVAPSANRSCAGMSLSLRRNMALIARPELGPDTYGLDGTPCDCALVALDPTKGLLQTLDLAPVLALSGPNYGWNISQDVAHSGTVSAAKMAAQCGVPAAASSSGLEADKSSKLEGAVEATVDLAVMLLHALSGRPARNWPRRYMPLPTKGRRHRHMSSAYAGPEPWEADASAVDGLLLDGFLDGDVIINANVPERWRRGGGYMTTGLGLQYYHDQFQVMGELVATNDRTLGGSVVYNNWYSISYAEAVEGSDWWALEQGAASVSTLQVWPEGHPLCFKDSVMAAALQPGHMGLPRWLAGAGGAGLAAAAPTVAAANN